MSENIATSSSNNEGQAKVIVVLALVLVVLGAVLYLNSPAYQAQQLIKEAKQLVAEKALGQAAAKLTEVIQGETEYVDEARSELVNLNDLNLLANAESAESLSVVQAFVNVAMANEQLFLNTLELAKIHQDKQLEASGQLLLAVKDLLLSNSLPESKPYEELQASYDALALAIFSTLNQSFPETADYAIELAELQERAGAFDTLLRLLEPFYSLFTTEEYQLSSGARILGQQLAYVNRHAEAYKILEPYVSINLVAFRTAEENYNRVLDTVWDEAIAALEQDQAPQSFYTKYEQADQDTQNQMVNEFYAQRRDASPLVAKAFEDYSLAADIVRVALDLGTVMLYLAQEQAEESERNQLLQQAESTFLAIKGAAGQSDEYRMYLGQVYYWLGKVDNAKALFEEFLTSKGRDIESLYWVSSILREVGEVTESRNLMLEVYETATDKNDKYIAASQLSLLAPTLDERITWAEKSDPNNLRTQADLANLKGGRAEQNNQLKVAETYYKKALGFYDQFDENSTTFNNSGLIYLSLYRVTNDTSYLDKGLELLDKAVALSPSDSIVLMNSADILQTVGVRSELSSVLFESSSITPNLSVISFLHNDEQSKKKIAEKLAGNSAIQKAVQYLEKVTLLAPKNKEPYDQLASIYGLFDDVDRLNTLNGRVGKTDLDVGDEKLERDAYVNGEKDPIYKDAFINRDKFYSGVLEGSAGKFNKETHAILTSYVLNARMNLESVGEQIEHLKLLEQAKTNYKNLPCSSTREDYQRALLLTVIDKDLVGHQRLADLNLEYSRLMSKEQILLTVLDLDPSLVSALNGNSRFKTYLALAKEDAQRYQNHVDPLRWGIISHFDSEFAGRLQSRAKRLEEQRLHVELSESLNFPTTSSIYARWQYYKMVAELEKMDELLSQARQLAIKLPIENNGQKSL